MNQELPPEQPNDDESSPDGDHEDESELVFRGRDETTDRVQFALHLSSKAAENIEKIRQLCGHTTFEETLQALLKLYIGRSGDGGGDSSDGDPTPSPDFDLFLSSLFESGGPWDADYEYTPGRPMPGDKDYEFGEDDDDEAGISLESLPA